MPDPTLISAKTFENHFHQDESVSGFPFCLFSCSPGCTGAHTPGLVSPRVVMVESVDGVELHTEAWGEEVLQGETKYPSYSVTDRWITQASPAYPI